VGERCFASLIRDVCCLNQHSGTTCGMLDAWNCERGQQARSADYGRKRSGKNEVLGNRKNKLRHILVLTRYLQIFEDFVDQDVQRSLA
jgi:hypothetical protein